MKKIKIIVLSLVVLVTTIVMSGYTKSASTNQKEEATFVLNFKQNQTINMFVTHGHCSTPFAGQVNNLVVDIPVRQDQGNPLENMKISFEINPNTFNVCKGQELTEMIKTPGLFISESNENITFRSTNVFTMGLDWYQVNGKMAIKGVEKEVKFFVTGIRNPKDAMPTALVLSSQLDLFDWGIDYEKIVNGISNDTPTKWMYFNMKIEI